MFYIRALAEVEQQFCFHPSGAFQRFLFKSHFLIIYIGDTKSMSSKLWENYPQTVFRIGQTKFL